MIEKNRHNLKRALDEFEFKEAQIRWDDLEKRMTVEAQNNELKSALSTLKPKVAPDIWDDISRELNSKSSGKNRITLIAAAVTLLMASTFLLIETKHKRSSEKITYTTEIMELPSAQTVNILAEKSEDEVLNYIDDHCIQMVTACDQPEFKELLKTYLELIDTGKEISLAIDSKNSNINLIKYRIRVEKQKTKIGKDLLKILKYS